MFHDGLESNSPVTQRLLVLRVLHGALVLGVVIFAAVAWVIVSGRSSPAATPGPNAGSPQVDVNVLRFVAGVLTFSALAMAIVMRQVIMQRLASQEEKPGDDTLINAYFTASLIGIALAESAALLAVVIVLTGRNPADFALAAAPILLMLILTPTRSRWGNFRERILNDRALRSGRP